MSHIVGWSLYPLDLNMEEEGVFHMNLARTTDESSYPSYYEICNTIRFLEDCRD